MGRRPDGAQVRSSRLFVRITPAGRDVIDQVRGGETISEFVRTAIADRVRVKQTRTRRK
jgi:hypothetical protein